MINKLLGLILVILLSLSWLHTSWVYAALQEPLNQDVANAYIKVLKDNQTQIKDYTWHDPESGERFSGGQITVANICGDSTPELIYIRSGETDQYFGQSRDQLCVWSYDGSSQLLLSTDFVAIGAVHFYGVFTTSDGAFYTYEKEGQSVDLTHRFTKHTLQSGKLLVNEIVERKPYGNGNYQYAYNGSSISKSKYEEMIWNIISKTDVILLQNYIYNKYTNNSPNWENQVEPRWGDVLPIKDVAMTYDEAITYLSSLKATPISSTILMDGKKTALDAYEIKGNNYFKLRDLASALNGGKKQFSVGWDNISNAISVIIGKHYTAVGGEMKRNEQGNERALPTTSKIMINGKNATLTAYNIKDNNYFKLRDIAAALNFGVTWDGAQNTIGIDTNKGYTGAVEK